MLGQSFRNTVLRNTTAASLAALMAAAVAPATWADPDEQPAAAAASCQSHAAPPPAVDASEAPKPGQQAATPLPVPAVTVGGDQLASCAAVLPANAPALPEGLGKAWVLADLDSGQVLAASDAHGRYRPASTIKTLLALVVLDEVPLDKNIMLTQGDWTADQESEAKIIDPGLSYSVRELLEAALMISSNGAANALARELGGVDETLKKMDAMAVRLHALDTRVASPAGLDAPGGNVSSAYDLALIYRAAMRNQVFREIMATSSVQMHGTPDDFKVQAQDHLLRSGFEGALGGKIGFTDDAQYTYVGAAERDGRRLVVTFMDDTGDYPAQAESLLDWGFGLDRNASVGQLVDPPPAHLPTVAPVAPHEQSSSSPATSLFLLAGVLTGSGILAYRELERRKGQTPTHA